jgi:ZIP family zinc transporter
VSSFLRVLGLAALPALGNLSGVLLAELVPVSHRTRSLALHAAAGVVLAIVGVVLMPRALVSRLPWLSVLSFALGGAFYFLVDQVIESLQQRRESQNDALTHIWAIVFGVAVDLFSDGLLIGTGSGISANLGLLLALGQILADIPEGFATLATLKQQSSSRERRILLALTSFVPVLGGASLGYWVVRGRPDIVRLSLLAFAAGILTTVTVEDIIPESHRGREIAMATFAFVGGFTLFTLLSIYLK